MSAAQPSFFARLSLALGILSNPDLAATVLRLQRGEIQPRPAPAPTPTPVPATQLKTAAPDSALQLLGLLQHDGRFVDFIQEDIAGFSDAEVGAAVRVVHEGCRKVMREHVTLEPVRSENEGSRITLQAGFDASAVRLIGNVAGQPPFTGTLVHRGWRSAGLKLPKLAAEHDVQVLAPAEVEL
jgi:hypothetical protein